VNVPLYRWARSLWLCTRFGHAYQPTFDRIDGAYVPTGFRCMTCGAQVDLNRRFVRWNA
jgi:hypothetical protein